MTTACPKCGYDAVGADKVCRSIMHDGVGCGDVSEYMNLQEKAAAFMAQQPAGLAPLWTMASGATPAASRASKRPRAPPQNRLGVSAWHFDPHDGDDTQDGAHWHRPLKTFGGLPQQAPGCSYKVLVVKKPKKSFAVLPPIIAEDHPIIAEDQRLRSSKGGAASESMIKLLKSRLTKAVRENLVSQGDMNLYMAYRKSGLEDHRLRCKQSTHDAFNTVNAKAKKEYRRKKTKEEKAKLEAEAQEVEVKVNHPPSPIGS
jgi:hypothetical protein